MVAFLVFTGYIVTNNINKSFRDIIKGNLQNPIVHKRVYIVNQIFNKRRNQDTNSTNKCIVMIVYIY